MKYSDDGVNTANKSQISFPEFKINDRIRITVDTISRLHVKFNKGVINEDFLKLIQFSQPRP